MPPHYSVPEGIPKRVNSSLGTFPQNQTARACTRSQISMEINTERIRLALQAGKPAEKAKHLNRIRSQTGYVQGFW